MLAKTILAEEPDVKCRNKNISLKILDLPCSCMQMAIDGWKWEAAVFHGRESFRVITPAYKAAQAHLLHCNLNLNSQGWVTGTPQLPGGTFLISPKRGQAPANHQNTHPCPRRTMVFY